MFVWRHFRPPAILKDEGGAVLVYVTLLLPVLIGTAVLAIDAARLSNLQTFLQNGADALALTGAAELDRKPTAITRANAALASLVQNNHKFGAASPAMITMDNVRFLSSLPASDANAIASSHETTDPTLARFVEVTVTPQTLNTMFPASFLGGSNTSTTGARAVAGFQSVVCKSMPMFICNPYEGTGTTIFDVMADPALRRRQIKMQLGTGGTSQYFPGNYGWLDSPIFGNGATALRDALALVNPPTCFEQNGVSQKTGNIESANDAINVRFDLWRGPYNNKNKDAAYRPARNVRKGYAPGKGGNGACNPNDNPSDPNPNKARLGRDSAYPYSGGRMGNGDWDFEAYWTTNYPGTAAPNGWSNANRPSRYEVYQHELGTIGSGGTDLVARQSPAPYNEKGAPACYSGGALSDEPDRRMLYGAIINCQDLNVQGNSGDPLPVLVFGKFFITEPVPNPPDPEAGAIFSELVGVIEPGTVSNDVARDIVQLYR